ncbi:MAG: DNA-processing protein DprA [Armatimonadota bacterium]|nr:DNA-processing protein DprA [Armatimonadota bacterium]
MASAWPPPYHRPLEGEALEAEVEAYVGLSLLPGIGPRTIKQWVEQVGRARAVWERLPQMVRTRAGRDDLIIAWRAAHPGRVVARARRCRQQVVVPGHPAYPERLWQLADPPPVLFVRGALDARPAVAVVGARRASPYGLQAAARLARDLAAAGVAVVSGLARGIDGAAHRGALDGGGRTVAVLGSAVDVIYPPEHVPLAEAIAARGALVSEFPPGTPPQPGHFPRRNRLISGLCLAVVIVEGAEDSGALVTVDYALAQGRDVFAVPGSIFSPVSRAPLALLRDGAKMATSADDILQELQVPAVPPVDAAPGGAAGSSDGGRPTDRLLAALAGGPATLDALVASTGLTAAEVAAAITLLEVQGRVVLHPGQLVAARAMPDRREP